jgi:PAS domain S-box-containing protein
MWCVDGDVLRWTMGWRASSDFGEFEATGRALAFARGAGLPGKVWAGGEPLWLDVEAQPALARYAAMREAGLRSALAFPIRGQAGFFGIMEFLCREVRPVDAEMLAMAAAIGSQSGAYIDRRRAEKATRFQAHLLDIVEQAVIATDLDGRVTYWNRFAAQLYGQPAAERLGHVITDLTTAPSSRVVAETVMERLLAGESWSGEFGVQRRDGKSFPIQLTQAPIYDEREHLVGVVGVSVDITERKRVEERLHFLAEASALLARSLDAETTLANLGRLAVPWLADWCSVNLLDAHDALVRVAGHHVDPAKEAMFNDLRRRHPPRAPELRLLLERERPGSPMLIADVSDADLAAIAGDAEQLAVYRRAGFRSAMIVPLYAAERLMGVIILATGESGRRYGRDDVAVAEDLAYRAALGLENTRLYQDARAAIRTRDDFLSIAAHELKTPVTSLMGYSQMLQRRLEGQPAMSERDLRALRVIREQTERLAKLVASLLDISRIETGHFALDRRPLDLCGLVRAQVEAAQSTLDRHTLTYHCAGASLIVEGDAMRLEQVVQNLVQNAIKYSPDGGPITVRVERQDGLAAIAVSDRGIGIPHDAQGHLFERFFRAPNAAGLSGGIGIGLYVVKEIVEQHGGSVGIASVEGEGSTFTVFLPLAVEQAPVYISGDMQRVGF